MLLALDIGNSSISLGLFDPAAEGAAPCFTAKLSADTGRTADEYAVLLRGMLSEGGYGEAVTAAVLGSVVPQLTHTLEAALRKLRGELPVLHMGGGVRTGISLRVEEPAALGADIVANAAAAVQLRGAPVVFVDFGTATVCGAVNQNRELVGVSISPGVAASLEGLRAAAARIPYLELKTPDTVLGKSTPAALSAGLVLGTACMVDGLLDRIRQELKLPEGEDLPVVATGGLCELVLPACRHTMTYEPDLTLCGLFHVYKATAERMAKRNK